MMMNCRVSILTGFLIMLTLPSVDATPIKLSAAQFQGHGELRLSDLDGWWFRKGNDVTAALHPDDTSGWTRMKPTELTPELADETGRIEGWFRLEFELDGSLSKVPLNLTRQLWSATDIYIDGVLVAQFGDTRSTYEPYNPTLKPGVPFPVSVGSPHVLAMHVVAYQTFITPRELRLDPPYLQDFINLANPAHQAFIQKQAKSTYILGGMTIAASASLFLLFLVLLFLNKSVRLFQLTTLLTLFVVLSTTGVFFEKVVDLSYATQKIVFLITNAIFLPIMTVLTLLITEWVLTRRVSWITYSLMFSIPFASAAGHLFNISLPFGLLQGVMVFYFGYLVIRSSRSMKSVEWAVVIAMIILTVGGVISVFLHKYYRVESAEYELPIKAAVLLSSPLLLLVYVSLSYKEVLAERKEVADKVIRVTEEKRALLEKQNDLLEVQVAQRTEALEKSLTDLKAAQSQLIQAEKMASLGELTAGIAHEIQNPLNFVNNFSEVNSELITELKNAVAKGDLNEVKSIAATLEENESKIVSHGKRADAIVKGMLQHSRASSGKKEPTDINALCDEYLRLAYHGLRAKDKSFNAKFETSLDPTLPKVNVVTQDIGRVVLNLINNAFYAVSERQKANSQEPKAKSQHPYGSYEPQVTVSTKNTGATVEICVTDNGNGIPESIKDKIFQPFFTTKPTGQGTGLGLSLSYDIVTKGHGGGLKVVSKEGEGSTFLITLPS